MINIYTVEHGQPFGKECKSLKYGMNCLDNAGETALADDFLRAVFADLNFLVPSLNPSDLIVPLGGGVLKLGINCIRKHFHNLVPVENPEKANAEGAYRMTVARHGKKEKENGQNPAQVSN